MNIPGKPLRLLSALGIAAMAAHAVPALARGPDVGPSDTTTITGNSGNSGPSATTTVPGTSAGQEMPHPGIPGGNERLQRLKNHPPSTGGGTIPGANEER